MALKNFFTGKSGVKFWVNIVMMVLIIVAMPVGALYMLDSFTHHGEKIEVPNVLGKSLYDAETMLKDRGLWLWSLTRCMTRVPHVARCWNSRQSQAMR